MLKQLNTLHGKLKLPAFFPDATSGFIRGINSSELDNTKVDGVVVNTYHLFKNKLIDKIKKKSGIHKYMKFNHPIISDSGGFQVLSLIHRNPQLGKIEDDRITFLLDRKKVVLTPEKCIQIQMKIGADIMMCLDDCTEADVSLKKKKESVDRTIDWARKCKKEFVKLTRNLKKKPLLFAIIQGGDNKNLRKYCADELLKIGFDGYAFGGWPVINHILLKDILKFTADCIPDNYPKYAMGVGKPGDIIECVKLGYNLFDCVIPTRDARHKRLYIFKNSKLKHGHFYIRGKHYNSEKRISNYCDCHSCKKYKLKHIHKAFKDKHNDSIRLTTIHNLRFYSSLMEKLRFKNGSK